MNRVPCPSFRFDCAFESYEAMQAFQAQQSMIFVGIVFGIGLLATVAIIVSVKTLELFTKDSNDDDN